VVGGVDNSDGDTGAKSSNKRRNKRKHTTVVCKSVIDYGIVSRSLFPRVDNFAVVSSCGLSDHNMLVCALSVPELPVEELQPFASVPQERCIRWDSRKRSSYVSALHSNECASARAAVVEQLRDPAASVSQIHEACEAWCDAIKAVAEPIFGISGNGQSVRTKDGRVAKRWFPQCRQKWSALQAAVRSRDSHAAAAARRVFNAAMLNHTLVLISSSGNRARTCFNQACCLQSLRSAVVC
jgi:hypothetical protein